MDGLMGMLEAVRDGGRPTVVHGVEITPRMAGVVLSLLGRLSGPRQEELTCMTLPAVLEEIRSALPGREEEDGQQREDPLRHADEDRTDG